VAAAYYNPTTCTIYVLEDTQESTHYDLITMCASAFIYILDMDYLIFQQGLEHAAPNVILTNWRADERFIDIMRSYGSPSVSITSRLAG
jgi:DNA mismatch repair protein MSH5